MTNILVKWIQKRLGLILDDDESSIADYARNGHLIVRLLLNYMIITEEQANNVLSSDSNNIECVEFNFKNYIKQWLKYVNINLTNFDISSVMRGNKYEAINLLYQLYLELREVSSVKVLTEKNIKQKFHPESHHFEVRPVRESLLDDFSINNHPASQMICDNYDVIHWHKDRLETLLQKCQTARENYLEILYKQTTNVVLDGSCIFSLHDSSIFYECPEVESLHEDYCDLVRQQEASKHLTPYEASSEKTKEVLQKYQKKNQEKAETDRLKVELQQTLLNKVMGEISNDRECQFDDIINEKLLEQSFYEKKMINTLVEVKMQKVIITKNKKIMHDLLEQREDKNFIDNILQMKKNLSEVKLEYYFEKERILRLHQEIYKQKEKLKAERVYSMCLDAVEDMIDVALRIADYKKQYGKEPSKRDMDKWKALFVKGEPINDIITPLETIIQPDVEEYEDISKEIQRQNSIDDEEFQKYLDYESPFEKEIISIGDEDTMYNMNCGINVIGNIVHSLLEIKYAKPTLIKPNISNCKIAACVNGLPDTTSLPILQKLLNEKKVKVVVLQDCVNFCLEAYKKEMTMEYPDTVLIEETEKVLDSKKGKDKKSKGKKEKKGKGNEKNDKKTKGKKGKETDTSEATTVEPEGPKFIDEITQTPIIFPNQEINLSHAAELGQIVDEQLHIGARITDVLLIQTFIAYLESLPDINGFVLINYPSNFVQAGLLEEFLTGCPVPGLENVNALKFTKSIKELGDFELRLDDPLPDPKKDMRKSRLVPDPKIIKHEPIYDSFLTAYIKMKQVEPDAETGEYDLPPIYEPMEGNDDPMDIFYSNLGCNYSLYYRKFTIDTIKYLGKLIIGDYTLPPKTSVELFGDIVNYLGAEYADLTKGGKPKSAKKGDKKEKPKDKKKKDKGTDKDSKKKSKSSDKSSGKDKKSKGKDKKDKKDKKNADKVVIVHEDKATQYPEHVEEEEPPPSDENIIPKIGEEGWDYVAIDIPTPIGICLATIWENSELVFTEDFKQVFFINRVLLDAFMPYAQYIQDHMTEVIKKPDNKQQLVTEFQRVYNEFDQDFRDDEEFKAEMHLRIRELQDKLYEISQENLYQSVEERQRIISDGWVPKQLIELCNNYINCFQLEIDRSIDTLQIINDYYTSMATSMPTENVLSKIILPKLSGANDIDENPLMKNQFIETLGNEDSNIDKTIFHEMLEQHLQLAEEALEDVRQVSKSIMEKTKAIFKPKKAGKSKSPTKGSSPKKGDKKGDKINILTLYEPRQIVMDNYDKIVQEWETAFQGENLRVDVRLNLLKNAAGSLIQQSVSIARNSFTSVNDNIKVRYDEECWAIDTLCKILRRAVEEEKPIQNEIILNGNECYLERLHKLFPDPVIIPEVIEEEESANIFSVSQLEKFTKVLFDIAPSGYIIERCFVYLIQDMIVCETEDGELLVPKLWKELWACDIDKMSEFFFDEAEYVTWKDFILLQLMIEIPTIEELIGLRSEFRNYDPDKNEYVTDYQYNTIQYWYESKLEKDIKRLQLLKQLIFKLYRINNELFNYTAFLLDLCKDESVIVGFAKVLSVCLGKIICWDKTVGEAFKNIILERREMHELAVQNREAEMADNLDMATSIVGQLIDTTVHKCDSVVIEDYYSETSKSNLDLNFVPKGTLPMPDEIEQYIRRTIEEDMEEDDENAFSNIAIGFEDRGTPDYAYFLPFDVLIAAVTMTLPWNAKAQNIEDKSFREKIEEIYEKCRNPEFNDMVLCHEFLYSAELAELLKNVRKYVYKNPIVIVQELINNH